MDRKNTIHYNENGLCAQNTQYIILGSTINMSGRGDAILKRKIIFTLFSYYFCTSTPVLKLDRTIFVNHNLSLDETIPNPIQQSIFLCGVGSVHIKVTCLGIEGTKTNTPPKLTLRNVASLKLIDCKNVYLFNIKLP